VYKTVTIGSQVWMAENLTYLPSVVGPGTGSEDASHETDPYYYIYGYVNTNVAAAKLTDNYQTYGVLYNWPAAMTACPEGWHLPSDAEWTTLTDYLGGWMVAADKLKETGTTHWYSESEGTTNESGFTALPGGYRLTFAFDDGTDGAFDCIGYSGYWWSSTQIDDNIAWCRSLSNNSSYVFRISNSKKEEGFSVRCLQDNNIVSVSTGTVTNITSTTASCSGNVISNGGSSVTASGVCWSTSENPTVANSKTTDGADLGPYTSIITGLSPNTIYYVRAYATNSEGTAYGEQKSFKTNYEEIGATFTDSRDGKVYKMVTIGEQVWMAENLAYLPSVVGSGTGSEDDGHEADPYYYVHVYNGTDVAAAKATANYSTYGVLYNWFAAMAGAASSNNNPSGVQGACPVGWHLPSDAEWKQLEMYLGMTKEEADGAGNRGTDEGGKLKETGTTHWYSESERTTNESGFSALPGSSRYNLGTFQNIGRDGLWWSSTEYVIIPGAWYRALYYDRSTVPRYCFSKAEGFSVRCVRD
jgi:uncharacterized protein (TIGR02145 family)